MTEEKTVSSEDLKRYFTKDLFARYVGIELIDARDGWARAMLNIEGHHLNGVRSVHGGAIFTLADLVFAAAANSRGRVAVAINGSIQFIKAPTGSVLYAEAREESRNRTLATYSVKITDDTGELISLFQGMAYRKSASVEYFETA